MTNLPESLLRELQHINAFDEAAFIAAHAYPPVTSVRKNPAKDIGLFTNNEKVPWCANGVYLPERPVFTLDPAYHTGAYYVQEASSMFLDHVLHTVINNRKSLRVLDMCAAPGGKSTLIASLLDKESLLVSNEVIRTRASILDENITRWGCMNTWVTSNDPRDLARLPGYFDLIVADVPCSGSGLFRKDQRALTDWTEGNVQLCCERQHRILADAWPCLKTGGIIVYATCSYSPQEDEEVLDWLAQTYDVGSVPIPIKDEWNIVSVASPKHNMTGYRFFPDKIKGEGLFMAVIRKNEDQESARPLKYKSVNDKKIQAHASYLLQDPNAVFIKSDNENYSAISPQHETDWQLIQTALYLRKTGLNLGNPAGKDWLPAHEVALSIDASRSLPGIEVNKEQALHFLKRADMGIPGLPKGWLMIRYKGLGLGWVKSLGNRVNNYLPMHWRIRMDITDSDLL